jgi:hypothetical protein
MVVAGIATQVIAHAHQPEYGTVAGWGFGSWTGWSHTAYNAARIGGWGLVVFGAVIVVFALVRELRPAGR